MTLRDKFVEFEAEFIDRWQEYIALHEEINKYRGRELGDDVEEVNKLIIQIQHLFVEMFPGIKFVLERHTVFVKAVHDYNKFIDDIQKGGATKVGQVEA